MDKGVRTSARQQKHFFGDAETTLFLFCCTCADALSLVSLASRDERLDG